MFPVAGIVWFTLSTPAVVKVRTSPNIAIAIIVPVEILRIAIVVPPNESKAES